MEYNSNNKLATLIVGVIISLLLVVTIALPLIQSFDHEEQYHNEGSVFYSKCDDETIKIRHSGNNILINDVVIGGTDLIGKPILFCDTGALWVTSISGSMYLQSNFETPSRQTVQGNSIFIEGKSISNTSTFSTNSTGKINGDLYIISENGDYTYSDTPYTDKNVKGIMVLKDTGDYSKSFKVNATKHIIIKTPTIPGINTMDYEGDITYSPVGELGIIKIEDTDIIGTFTTGVTREFSAVYFVPVDIDKTTMPGAIKPIMYVIPVILLMSMIASIGYYITTRHNLE